MKKKIRKISKKFENPFDGYEVNVIMWDDECEGIQERVNEMFLSMGKLTTMQKRAIVDILSSAVNREELFGPV